MKMCTGNNRIVKDPSSVADTDSHTLTHYALTFGVDFESERCIGHVILRLKTLISNPKKLTLDSLGLEVFEARVWSGHGQEHDEASSISFQFKDESEFLGRLTLNLDEAGLNLDKGTEYSISIRYCTQKNAPALCFVEPDATHAKQHPFLFTQGQACLNRSFFPCFDTPSVRATYDATVVVPKELVALMSANHCNEIEDGTVKGLPLNSFPEVQTRLSHPSSSWTCDDATHHVFRFDMPHTIPIYLLALAVGDLRCAEIGPRSRVWAETTQIAAAEAEFKPNSPVEKYIATAEELYGPYLWSRYDLLVCPPSFSFGGMENPMLTFVTPCLLAGDQSLLDVVAPLNVLYTLCTAHEIAHSWSGNLVTNARFGEFFLNEGFTMYIQRRITTIVHGSEFTSMEVSAGRKLLTMCIDDFGKDHPFTKLIVSIDKDTNPDDTYCETPYEKGFAFVSYLRAAAGSDEIFDTWMRTYFDTYKWQCITTVDVLTSFFDFFPLLKGSWSADTFNASTTDTAYSTAGVSASPENIERVSQLPEQVQAYFSEHAMALSERTTKPLRHPYAEGGLAYVPGYELQRWLHQPGYAIYYPSTSGAMDLENDARSLAQIWIGHASAVQTRELTAQFLDSIQDDFTATEVWLQWPIYQVLYLLDYFHEHIQQQQRDQANVTITREQCTPPPPAALPDDRVPVYPNETYTYIQNLLRLVDRAFNFGDSKNAEILLRWSLLVAEGQFEEGYAALTEFAKSQGKQKYTVPVFRAFLDAPYVMKDSADEPNGKKSTHFIYHSPGRMLAPNLFAAIRSSLFSSVRLRVKTMIEDGGLVSPE